MIDLCNREMSKALTSQTLATEVQDKGARAVSETHREREQAVNESDREMIAYTFDTLLGWITRANFGPDTSPPHFEFVEESDDLDAWVERIDKARKFISVPRAFAHEKLGIPQPQAGEDVLGAPAGGAEFGRCPHCGGHDFARAVDLATDAAEQAAVDDLVDGLTSAELQAQAEDLVKPVLAFIESEGLEAAHARLAEAYPDVDDGKLREKLARMLFVADVWGRINARAG